MNDIQFNVAVSRNKQMMFERDLEKMEKDIKDALVRELKYDGKSVIVKAIKSNEVPF